jgi:hypothetical protein
MRELTKAMGSYFLAMSLFGVKQMENLITPDERGQRIGPAAQAFDSVTAATVNQLADGYATAFRAFDSAQRAVFGPWFSAFLPFLNHDESASSPKVAWEQTEQGGDPLRSESLDHASGVAMELGESWPEEIIFRRSQ